MRQVISDLIASLKFNRKTQFIGGLVMAVAALAILLNTKEKAVRPLVVQSLAPLENSSIRPSRDEIYDEFAARINDEIESSRREKAQLGAEVRTVREDLQALEARVVSVLKILLQQRESNDLDPANERMAMSAVEAPEEVPHTQDSQGLEEEGMIEFGEHGSDMSRPLPPPFRKSSARVGPGDRVRVQLDSGLNAVADNTPYPAVFRLAGDIHGPNGSSLPLGDAYLIAAAQASMGESRVLFRLVKLNVQLPSGLRREIDVDGWIVGEDGLRGMAGVSVDPLGKKVAVAMLAGGVESAGFGLSAAQYETSSGINGTQRTYSGDLATTALGSGLSGGAGVWSDWLRRQMELYPPHVQVMSGRQVTAVFSEAFSVSGLLEELDEDFADS